MKEDRTSSSWALIYIMLLDMQNENHKWFIDLKNDIISHLDA